MFRTVPLSIISSFSLYTQQRYMSYRFADSLKSANLYVLLSVQWKTADDGQRNCPKHVKFYSKNKFEKWVHPVGFIIRIYHDTRSIECQICLFSWCSLYPGLRFNIYWCLMYFDHLPKPHNSSPLEATSSKPPIYHHRHILRLYYLAI